VISDGRLPTVTVAVPVRNEGRQLEACLTAVLASNYPKLEVLAFDDHSSDHTPEIIKSFAHAGVRFIRTAEPLDGWLPKNQAYDSLAREANGDYILFCGADIRLGIQSIRQLVAYAESRHKHMLAILPLNRKFTAVPILQAMRYYWELAPPRRFFQRPPVLSSSWLIDRHALQRYGGFDSIRQSIAPEAKLARQAMLDHDGYGFLRSNHALDITSEKAFKDQEETAQLRRYPQAHRRPEMVLIFTVGQAALLIGPLLILVVAVLARAGWPLLAVAATAFLLHSYAFGMIQRRIFPNAAPWKAYAAFIPSIAADIWYLNQSMILYEFAHVSWKDRNVSRPVMRISEDLK
jgi:chlorobactene glucosyltransferase